MEGENHNREDQFDYVGSQARKNTPSVASGDRYSRVSDGDNTPIRKFCGKYTVPTWAALPLIQKAEEETQRYIDKFSECFDAYAEKKLVAREALKHVKYVTAYGYKQVDGETIVDEQEQAIMRRILKLRAQGMICRRVADILNNDGRRTRRGNLWTDDNVNHVSNIRYKKQNRMAGSGAMGG